MPPYRVAIVGTGKSVDNHLKALKAVADRAELVAAVDVDIDRLNTVCGEHSIPNRYTSIDAMLAEQQPDLVNIVTPPATHKTLIIKCLEAGSWVYCEKPLCASLAEFDEIQAAEDRSSGYVSTVFQWRFGSAAQHLKRLIDQQALGRPLVGVCNTLWYRPAEYYRSPWRGRWKTEIGGPTATLGIHLMDLFLWLMGDWSEIRAMTGTLARDIEVEDVSMAMLRFENGAMGSLVNSVLSPRQESYMRLDFADATVEVNALYRYNNDHWRFTLPDNTANPAARAHWEALSENTPGNHEIQLRQILDCMARDERPPVSSLDARRILELIASLYKAAYTGGSVLRGEITPDDSFYHAMNGLPQSLEPS